MSKDQNSADADYYHDFTDDEVAQMLYFDDEENSDPVQEYFYMKDEWITPDSKNSSSPKVTSNKKQNQDMEKNVIDTGERSVVDLDKDAPEDEELVFLELDTNKAAQVVEFYAPWCPHCKHFKYEYIEIAREVTRRQIETPVQFHAVSCGLFRPLCRAYGITGFPVVYGWPVGSSVWDDEGIELNVPGEPPMSADSVAKALDITLAHEAKDIEKHNFTNSEDQRNHEKNMIQLGQRAAKKKLQWQQYPSRINERYHNAATSLAYVLKNAVLMEEHDTLDDRRGPALKDFVDLVHWATPQTWHIRTGLVHDLQANMEEIIKGKVKLESIVESHQSKLVGEGYWGGLTLSQSQKHKVLGLGGDVPVARAPVSDKKSIIKINSKWSEACTHGERGMGLTCGLWDLFHILTIGSTRPNRQILGFQSGALITPRDVAEIIKRFIVSFFPCDVCRFNFKDMYLNCGHGHCTRLVGVMPDLMSAGSNDTNTLAADQSRRELPLWFWEVHNSVNVRLMKEGAARQGRNVTQEEILAAKFPSRKMCPQCWVDRNMEEWNQDAVLEFLTSWYWPTNDKASSIRLTMERRLQGRTNFVKPNAGGRFEFPFALCFILTAIGGLLVVAKRVHHGQKLKSG